MTRRTGPAGTAALLVGFTAAVLLRVAIGGRDVASSTAAGLVFAACLTTLTLVAGATVGFSSRAAGLGLAGAAMLCLPSLVGHALHPGVVPGGSFPRWAVLIVVVAVAEEAFLRGALYSTVRDLRGDTAALLITSLAFTALHLPLYGWGSAPLDLAVGLVLGVLREQTGGWAAPALTHVGADLAAWWLR